jgi:hypothetical protein
MAPRSGSKTRLYEIRLLGHGHDALLFATEKMTDDEAAEHARTLLQRHGDRDRDRAEVWRGRKLVRQV